MAIPTRVFFYSPTQLLTSDTNASKIPLDRSTQVGQFCVYRVGGLVRQECFAFASNAALQAPHWYLMTIWFNLKHHCEAVVCCLPSTRSHDSQESAANRSRAPPCFRASGRHCVFQSLYGMGKGAQHVAGPPATAVREHR